MKTLTKKTVFTNIKLVNDLKDGKGKAYLLLVDYYHDMLFIYAYQLCRNHTLSQDIVQNVFMKTWEKRDKLNPNLSIKAFLYKAVYHNFINEYKKDKSRNTLERLYIDTIVKFGDDFDLTSYQKKLDLINKEIEKLPKKCKMIFLLSKKDGLTNKEVSNFLNISIKTVENQITIAFAKIRKGSKEQIKNILFILTSYN